MPGEQPPNLPKRDEGRKDERMASFGPRKPITPPTPQPEPTEGPDETTITIDQATGEAGLRNLLKRQAAEDERLRNMTDREAGKYEVQFYLRNNRKPESREELVAWIKSLNSPSEPE